MIKKIKKLFSGKSKGKENISAKQEQVQHVIGVIILAVFLYAFYHYNTANKTAIKKTETVFDGSFDAGFSKNSDEALIEKQQRQINKLEQAELERKKISLKKGASNKDNHTQEIIKELQKTVEKLRKETKETKSQLQVAFIKSNQSSINNIAARPPTREEMQLKNKYLTRLKNARYQKAGIQTVRFHYPVKKKEERTEKNYVWAGTFAEGILLTGTKADAGINGSKNHGVGTIRLISGGIMPNGKRSRLKDCFVLVSSYGDLSGDSVIMNLQTLSCAGRQINFEQKVYGSVFDTDAMQDIRGTSILNTKPLLGYTAAAGLLAGIGDGLKSIGSAQSIGTNGAITTFSATSLARNAVGGAMTNPANKISEYVMKIADIYHPLVIARAGRKVTVQFTKGFWIDKAHQKYESGLAIDEKQHESSEVKVSQSKMNFQGETQQDSAHDNPFQMAAKATTSKQLQPAEQQFLKQKLASSKPLFTSVQ